LAFRQMLQDWLDLRQKRVNRNMIVCHLLLGSDFVPPTRLVLAHRANIVYYLCHQVNLEGLSRSAAQARVAKLNSEIAALAYSLPKIKRVLRRFARSESLGCADTDLAAKLHELSAKYLISPPKLFQFMQRHHAMAEIAEQILCERARRVY
jgi:FKBP-type peptidyl-prolyl cis-trans isomerase (trigger factor)